MRSVRRCSVAALLVLFVVGTTACSVDAPMSSTSGETTVGADGFEVAIDGITVTGPSGVAPEGTPVIVRRSEEPETTDVAWGGALEPHGLPLEISLGEDLQPAAPITIEFTLDPEVEAEGARFVVVSRDSADESFRAVPADVGERSVIATAEHLSIFWLFQVAGDFFQPISDAIARFTGFGFDAPECFGQPVDLDGTTYSIDRSNDRVYPCVQVRDGALVASVYANAPFVWRVFADGTGTTLPPIASVDRSGIATVALHNAIFGHSDKESVLVPGGRADVALDGDSLPGALRLNADAGLGLVAVLVAGVDALLTVYGITLDVNELAHVGECAGDVLGLVILDDVDAGDVGQIAATTLNCFATFAGSSTASIIIATATSLTGLLVTQAWGAVDQVTGNGSISLPISATRQPAANPPLDLSVFKTESGVACDIGEGDGGPGAVMECFAPEPQYSVYLRHEDVTVRCPAFFQLAVALEWEGDMGCAETSVDGPTLTPGTVTQSNGFTCTVNSDSIECVFQLLSGESGYRIGSDVFESFDVVNGTPEVRFTCDKSRPC